MLSTGMFKLLSTLVSSLRNIFTLDISNQNKGHSLFFCLFVFVFFAPKDLKKNYVAFQTFGFERT